MHGWMDAYMHACMHVSVCEYVYYIVLCILNYIYMYVRAQKNVYQCIMYGRWSQVDWGIPTQKAPGFPTTYQLMWSDAQSSVAGASA